MLNFVKCFFCNCWSDYMIFILHFVNVVYHTDCSTNVEQSLDPWNKSQLIMVYDPLMYCWIWFAHILLRIFFTYVQQGYWPIIIFSYGRQPCLVLVSGYYWTCKIHLKEFLPLLFFGRIWERLVLVLLWMFGRIHQQSHQVLDFCCCEAFGYLFNLLTGLLRFFYFFMIKYW